MGTYSHKSFFCPFYKADRRKGDQFIISCECGILRLTGRPAFNSYTGRYCCHTHDWVQCTMAAATKEYYEA